MADLSPRARELLAAAHGADEPGPADFQRVRRGVLLRIGSAGFGATVFSLCLQRAQAFLGAAAPKLAAVMALALGGSAVYQHAQHSAPPPSPASVVLQQPSRPVVVLAPHEVPPQATDVSSKPVGMPAAAGVGHLPVARRPRTAPTAPEAAGSTLDAEIRWVRAADAALRAGNVSVAQGLLDDHARDFPSGALAEEREGLRIVAGCQSQAPDGKRQATRFLERSPRSLLAGRLRAACPSL